MWSASLDPCLCLSHKSASSFSKRAVAWGCGTMFGSAFHWAFSSLSWLSGCGPSKDRIWPPLCAGCRNLSRYQAIQILMGTLLLALTCATNISTNGCTFRGHSAELSAFPSRFSQCASLRPIWMSSRKSIPRRSTPNCPAMSHSKLSEDNQSINQSSSCSE